MSKAVEAVVAKGKKHIFTMHGMARRVKSSLVAVAGYYLGLGVLDVTTTIDQFTDLALRPYALLGILLVLLGTGTTTGADK